jgi:hypothetical protein
LLDSLQRTEAYASAHRTSRASHLNLFEQPAGYSLMARVFSRQLIACTVVAKPVIPECLYRESR